MKVDVVFIAKIDSSERERLFKQTIKSFYENTNENLMGNVVVVNDNSGIDFIEKWIGDEIGSTCLIVNNHPEIGVGGSKNKGINVIKKRSELLYLADSDVYFMKGWLDRMLGCYEVYKNEYKIIGGGVHPYLQPRLHEGNNEITSHDAISGWSWLLSYDTWTRYGKLADNSLGTGQSEDWEYCQRVRKDGFKVGCVQPQVIIHTGMTNTEGADIVGREVSEALAIGIKSDVLLL